MRVWLDPGGWRPAASPPPMCRWRSSANNFQSAPGQAKGYFTVTNIATNTGLTNSTQFREMVVKAQGGSLVRLQDIATVDLGAAEHQFHRS